MKVKIQQRSVYHKFAEVEVELNENEWQDYKTEHGKYTPIQDFIMHKEDLWVDKVDEAMSKAPYHYGFGTDDDANDHHNSCMVDTHEESEWRYETEREGGHL